MKKENPQISIIIPTYNRPHFLKEAISSVLSQNYQDFEIIVVDDGSTDNTKEAIKSINNKRIIYLYQKHKGRSVARNRAIEIARGKYLAFLDDDDLFLPGKLKKQIEILEKNKDYGMVYTSALNIDEKGNVQDFVYRATKSGNIYKNVAFLIPLVVILPTVMVRKDIVTSLNGFDEKMRRFEDTDMWRRIAKRYNICAIKEPLTKICAHRGNQMEHPLKFFRAIDYYVKKIFREDKDKGFLFLRNGAATLYLYYAVALLTQKPNYRKYFGKFILRSLKYWPFTISIYYHLFLKLLSYLKKQLIEKQTS